VTTRQKWSTLSGFDPVRREIAKLSLERLISDGRIHPTRIEEVVEKVRKEVDVNIREEAKRLSSTSGFPASILSSSRHWAGLKYRTSYARTCSSIPARLPISPA